jgi:hypothetical protein
MALIILSACYWYYFPGTGGSVTGGLPTLPPFVVSVAVAGVILMVAAAISEFIPNRVDLALSYLASCVGIGAVLTLLIAPLLSPAAPAFALDRVAQALPWAMTMAAVFTSMLSKELNQ